LLDAAHDLRGPAAPGDVLARQIHHGGFGGDELGPARPGPAVKGRANDARMGRAQAKHGGNLFRPPRGHDDFNAPADKQPRQG